MIMLLFSDITTHLGYFGLMIGAFDVDALRLLPVIFIWYAATERLRIECALLCCY